MCAGIVSVPDPDFQRHYFYRQRQTARASGSTTNASDPVSVSAKGETAWERQQREKRG